MAPHADFKDGESIVRMAAPEKPPFSASPPRLLIIGAGNRGIAYAKAIASCTNGICIGIAEPVAKVRYWFGREFIWGEKGPSEGQEFADWRDFVTWEKDRRKRAAAGEKVDEGVDGIFICVQDQMHKEVVLGVAPLGIHIMCEKPLATSLEDCVDIYKAMVPKGSTTPSKIFAVGHVLRYSPHNILLRKLLLEDKVIGDIMSVNHTEPVGWWHFAHSFVRYIALDPLLSTYRILKPAHLPTTVSSSGHLQYFKKSRKPIEAGTATNCLSCAYEPSCKYSAKLLYTTSDMGQKIVNKRRIVLPDIEDYIEKGGVEAGQNALLTKLAEDYDEKTPVSEISKRSWYGRCVYEADNDVCDNQTVTMTWDDNTAGTGAKIATLHMVAFTKKICQRYTNIYGVDGEVYADGASIKVQNFHSGTTQMYYPYIPNEQGHGDADEGLARQFVLAIDRVKNHGQEVAEAQIEHLGCSLEEVVRSHAMVFAAEEARLNKTVVDFPSWWTKEVEARLN